MIGSSSPATCRGFRRHIGVAVAAGLLGAMCWTRAAALPSMLPAQGAAVPGAATAAPISACGGDNEWPPSSYFGGNATQARELRPVVGYSVDVLRAALPERTIDARLLPWARCLALGRTGRVNIIMGATHTPERERTFRFSQAYLQLTPAYVYSARRFPRGIMLDNAAAWADRRVCALRGANVQAFGVPDDIPVDGSATFKTLFSKLALGHCDIIVEFAEVVRGLRKLGLPELATDDLKWAPLPGQPQQQAHFAISRELRGSLQLVRELDAGIRRLRAKGELQRLLARHQH